MIKLRPDERVVLTGPALAGRLVRIVVTKIDRGRVLLGLEADEDVTIQREQVWLDAQRKGGA